MSMMHVRWGRLYRGTPAELALEEALAAAGVPYRNQFPGFLFGVRFFVDFLLPTLGLVIEVDDDSHNRPDKMAADVERTATLEREWGVRVVRCTNHEALTDPVGTVRRLLAGSRRVHSLVDGLPATRKCPPKIRREAKSQARQRARKRHATRHELSRKDECL